MNRVDHWQIARGKATRMAVLSALRTNPHATIDTIASVVGVHSNTVLRACRRLRVEGLLDESRRVCEVTESGLHELASNGERHK